MAEQSPYIAAESSSHEGDYQYQLLTGHQRTDGSFKTDEQLRMEYIQLTDKLIYAMTDGVEVTDPATGERQTEKPDVVVWLDKSARPLAWLTKELWPKLAPDSDSDEVPPMPKFMFVNIDREQWVNSVDPEGAGGVDIERVDQSIIRSLRSIYVEPKYKRNGITEEIDTAPTQLDGKTILIVDEVRATGRTLDIAKKFYQRAFPTAKVAGMHWMSGVAATKQGALGNRDLPVWYKSDEQTGRGVGDREATISQRSSNTTQRLGAWFLSTRLEGPDEPSHTLREELHQLATHPDVPVLPSFSRPDREKRMAILNGTSYDAVKKEVQRIKGIKT
jgi:hypothetical protein